MNKALRLLTPLAVFFALTTILLVIFSTRLKLLGFDIYVLFAANILLFMLSIISFSLQIRSMSSTNPHVFVRSVMSGMLLKMLICVALTFGYVYNAGSNYNKRSLLLSLMLYLIYLSLEVFAGMKMNKKKNV
jgi:predicted neutral ceramidase superfamily lipid hydrolase